MEKYGEIWRNMEKYVYSLRSSIKSIVSIISRMESEIEQTHIISDYFDRKSFRNNWM